MCPISEEPVPRSPDLVVTSVSTQLMEATGSTATRVSENVLGQQVVAEGVETPSAALTLMQHRCHRAQGFLLSRPIPGNEMETLLAARWLPMPFVADREALSAGAT
jgi:predicted signal transduction protein with EAL and GGDEF domain